MKIFAGMDLASESVVFCVMDEGGKRLARGKMSWSKKRWRGFVDKYGAGNLEVAFETGPEGYRAQFLLEKLGVETYPFHAASFEAIWKTNKKTDRIDAEKICRALRAGSLPERIQLGTKDEAHLRNLVRQREGCIRALDRAHLTATNLARQWDVGKLPSYSRDQAEAWWEEVCERFAPRQENIVRRLYRSVLGKLQDMQEIEEEIMSMIDIMNLQDESRRLQTIPGVGPVTAMAILTYIGRGHRFRNGRKVLAYTGLIPSVSQTGKQAARLGHITKKGPAILRKVLVQAARAAARGHQITRTRWYGWFLRVKRRRGDKVAIVGLARKILLASYAVLRDGTVWEPDKLRPRAT